VSLILADYENMIIENEQNTWIVVGKPEQKIKQTKKLVTAKQDGKVKAPPYKLKPPPYKLKPAPPTPKKIGDSKYVWKQFPLSTCKCCGMQGHIVKD
jgi:hypothetical protein